MANREDIFKAVYKYYPRVTEGDKIREEKDKLRQKKINNKGGEEQERLLQDITKIAEKYAVVDWTDSESCCYEYLVLLHKNVPILDDDRILMKVLNGIRYDLRIVVSILEPYYFTVVDVTKHIEQGDQWEFARTKAYNEETRTLLGRIDEFFFKKGYTELSDKEALTLLPDIETKYKEIGKANVFDCIFTDLLA